MSTESKRGEGAAEELGGKVKKVAGQIIGNEQMEAEGRAKELKGEAKQESAKAAGRAEGKVNEVVGAVKNRVGAVIGNEQMQAEGKVKEMKGEAKQKANESLRSRPRGLASQPGGVPDPPPVSHREEPGRTDCDREDDERHHEPHGERRIAEQRTR